MIVTGTLTNADGSLNHIEVEGTTYDEAREKLDALVQDGQQLIVIRTDRY